MNKINVSVIGAGGISRVHFSALLKLQDQASLNTVVDIDLEAARTAADKYGAARSSTDLKDAVGDDTDAVFICTPTHLHEQAAVAALDAGKHVFCEKPLARTFEQAQQIVAAQKRSGKICSVGFVRRYDEEWLKFRTAVQDGAIGRPLVWHDVSCGSGPPKSWFHVDEQGGGPFLDGAIHTLDFGLYTFGPAEWVFTHGRTLNPEHTAIDTGSATVRYRSGDELLLAWSWGLPGDCRGTRVFELLGPKGTITWPAPGSSDASKDSSFGRFVINSGSEKEGHDFAADSLSRGYDLQVEQFLAAIRGETQVRADVRAGLEALKLALGLLESARTFNVVLL